jgi:hypothetical protein
MGAGVRQVSDVVDLLYAGDLAKRLGAEVCANGAIEVTESVLG